MATETYLDDDVLDLESTIREIDAACERTNPKLSASHPQPIRSQNRADPSSSRSSCVRNKKKSGAYRQSTLDRFVEVASPRPPIENVTVGDRSFVEIDAEAAKTWIYPTNTSFREYQFDITKKALYSNTLVALPTGLGKTLIAAVVMYNYFRWFPKGKIVFAAPSRPLVTQQIKACHKLVGMPQKYTIEMTGQTNRAKRARFWRAKRVFFVTPQVLENDMQSGICSVKNMVCLVIDEAHRALGNSSYCVAVRKLMAVPVKLRILALTATPGSTLQAIQNIIDDLHISSFEFRDESYPDVSPYVHDRKIELIKVTMGKDAVEINDLLMEVTRLYGSRLLAIGVLQNSNYQTLSPCDLANLVNKFRKAPPPNLPQEEYDGVENIFEALLTLNYICMRLSSNGIRSAYEVLEEKLKNRCFPTLMIGNDVIRQAKLLMHRKMSNDETDPKLSKMLEVLIDHFRSKDPQNSRVIIFTNFRSSVRNIIYALARIHELVKASQFIGQGPGKTTKGQSQEVQQAVLKKFQTGGYNVLVSTSIGEEGLDITEVDLVICFDANVSALRMNQRMGRTGRNRNGRVVILACEGLELKDYRRKHTSDEGLRQFMSYGGVNSFKFHPSSRMIPDMFEPEAQKIELVIAPYVPPGQKLKDDRDQSIFKYFESMSGRSTSTPVTLNGSMEPFQRLSFDENTNTNTSTQCLVDEKFEIEAERDSSDSEVVDDIGTCQTSCTLNEAAELSELSDCEVVTDDGNHWTICMLNKAAELSESSGSDSQQERTTLHEAERTPDTPISKRTRLNGTHHGEMKEKIVQFNDICDDFEDIEVNPQLVNDIDHHSSPKRKRKQNVDALVFMDEEDEVSTEAEEYDYDCYEEDLEESSYDDIYESDSSGTDMMSVDRQSLVNESPSWVQKNRS